MPNLLVDILSRSETLPYLLVGVPPSLNYSKTGVIYSDLHKLDSVEQRATKYSNQFTPFLHLYSNVRYITSKIGRLFHKYTWAFDVSGHFIHFEVGMKIMKINSLAQQTQNICMPFIQCWTNVEDVGPTLYKCYANIVYWGGGALGEFNAFNTCLYLLTFYYSDLHQVERVTSSNLNPCAAKTAYIRFQATFRLNKILIKIALYLVVDDQLVKKVNLGVVFFHK